MKRYERMMAAIAAVLLASCQGEPCVKCIEERQLAEKKGNRVELLVSAAPATKVADALAQDEAKINTAILYVFESEKGFLHSQYENRDGNFSITLADGEYDFAVLINVPAQKIATLGELRGSVSTLADNRPGCFVMYGLTRGVDIVTSRSLTLPVHRIVSKINYRLSVEWKSPVYDGCELSVKGAYMSNVAGDAAYDDENYEPQRWHNRMFYGPDEASILLFGQESCNMSDGDEMTSDHTFFVYPNRSSDCHSKGAFTPRCTRLVVEAALAGETYYYPVTLPDIEPNTAYNVILKVRGPGMNHPEDEDIAMSAVDVDICVCDWETGETIREEF